MQTKKVIIATGGTGGHIFPAQILAEQLVAQDVAVLFIGGGLKGNRYFKKEKFPYVEISSSTPFKGNIFLSAWKILKGTFQSFKEILLYKPDLIVGFGSFYSFPVLLAARGKNIPYILFEPNAFPGKVNQFFSKWAQTSAIQFLEAKKKLQSPCVEVEMPRMEKKKISLEEAREYFYLMRDRFTFLVFGGSQGAESINDLFCKSVQGLELSKENFQVLHIAGKQERVESIRKWYESQQIHCCVKAFEEKMEFAWSAADVVVCRAGASTIAEQIVFEVPGILIPFPRASDNHQMHNALFLEKEVGGGIACAESALTVDSMRGILDRFTVRETLVLMKDAMLLFKKKRHKKELIEIVLSLLERGEGSSP